MIKLYQTFQSPYNFRKASFCFTLHPQGVCGSNPQKYLLSGFFSAGTLLPQKPLIQAPFYNYVLKNEWSISLSSISSFLHISLNPFIMSAVGEQQKKQTSCFDKKFIAAPHQLTQRKKILFFSPPSLFLLFFFVFIFWSTETTTANLQGMTLQPIRKY